MKKLFLLPLLLLLVMSISCQTSFQGNEKVIILDDYNEISSLEELINLPEFKDKILFINLYSFYCKHSIEEFPHLKKLQKHIQDNPKFKKDVAYIHLSTPKWASESFWRSNVEEFNLPGYHFLMNEEFQDEFWSHFPEEQRKTPFFIEVTKDKKMSIKNTPSGMFEQVPINASLNNFKLQTFKFIEANLDSVVSNHPNNFDLLFQFDASSKQKISFFTYSRSNPDNSKEVDAWKDLRVFAEKSFDSISGKDDLTGYSFGIPLNAKTLDSIIPE